MNKLVALLNEYEKERKSGFTWRSIDSYDNCVYGVDCDGETEVTMYSDLYSKYYGFIKRLVDNDKIERLAFAESGLLGKYTDFELSYDTPREDYTNMLLMELSIQDSPIEYLISVLR